MQGASPGDPSPSRDLRFGQGGVGMKSLLPSLVPFPLSYKYTGHQNVCSHSSS